MKSNEEKIPKVPRNFRLEPILNEELVKFSKLAGVSETQIVEDALRYYLTEGIIKHAEQTAKVLRETNSMALWGSRVRIPQAPPSSESSPKVCKEKADSLSGVVKLGPNIYDVVSDNDVQLVAKNKLPRKFKELSLAE